MKLKVISFWAGPGAGKSTTAAALFAHMKRLRYRVEIVTEYAKDLTYEKNHTARRNQLKVLVEQNYRIHMLEDQVEYVITDSPLPLSLIYCHPEERDWLSPLIAHLWKQYDNLPLILKRTQSEYMPYGRNQTESEAKTLDTLIFKLALQFGAKTIVNPDAPDVEEEILHTLKEHYD